MSGVWRLRNALTRSQHRTRPGLRSPRSARPRRAARFGHQPELGERHANGLLRCAQMVRVDTFHPEPWLPAEVRSELGNYRRSGYDRGHMASNGDMGDEAGQRDSFSLANMKRFAVKDPRWEPSARIGARSVLCGGAQQ